ncbi:hypothetical protein E2N92_01430 [Methanofollis formosanus]|uniref:Transglutaminase-like domain-containing protein n=1 Tax=Methanofollis formosanus TaxID=299308 RepID=A0A8G0ZYY6_9EURY|nr:transglutaminase domain-containing protein [Methanofollis formosanus]QYZ78185.1 hypothetical protein E2N92_01430 [Methanofollis formosanus]
MKSKNAVRILTLLLLTGAFIVPVMAEEKDVASLNTFEIPGCINGSPNWVGPQDLSEYSRYDPPFEVTEPSKETQKKLNPNVIFINTSDMPTDAKVSSEEVIFNSDGSYSVMRTQRDQNVENELKSTADVRFVNAQISWYWVQDSIVRNLITIHNSGSAPASGKVIVISTEDRIGYYNTFSNIPPSANETVLVAFKVPTANSVGRKPIALEVRVDPNDARTDYWSMPFDGIETYSNNVDHYPDPDGGTNLEASGLYHIPDGALSGESYGQIIEAATAGDDTTTPYDTASQIIPYVYGAMNYTLGYPEGHYTASDIWIKDHQYCGVCDEYATLFNSFTRGLGIPTRQYYMGMINSTGVPTAHGLAVIWDGGDWIHADPTWNVFDNPEVYTESGYSNITLSNMIHADDNRYTGSDDPFINDQLLHFWNDFEVIPIDNF